MSPLEPKMCVYVKLNMMTREVTGVAQFMAALVEQPAEIANALLSPFGKDESLFVQVNMRNMPQQNQSLRNQMKH